MLPVGAVSHAYTGAVRSLFVDFTPSLFLLALSRVNDVNKQQNKIGSETGKDGVGDGVQI